MPAYSIVIPVYNEAENIANVLSEMPKGAEIIVVDDGSTDRSARIAKRYAKVIRHGSNRGYGAALKTGIKAAKNDIIITADGDGSYEVKDIPKLVKELRGCDMVIGKREGSVFNENFGRKIGKKILVLFGNFLTGKKIEDINSGMRCFRKKMIVKYFKFLCDRFSFSTGATISYLNAGHSVKFVPIKYKRRGGTSKIRFWRDGANFLVLLIRTAAYFRPLRVFLPPAFVLFCIGLFMGIWDFIFFGDIGEKEIFFMIGGMIIGSFGLTCDIIVKRG